MRSLSVIFWKGAATLLPLVVTVYALYWVVVSVERLLRRLVPLDISMEDAMRLVLTAGVRSR